MADADNPAFDREGKYLYFTASTNAGATSDGLDMTSDLYQVTSYVYAAVLATSEASPIAPELGDEKTPSEKKAEEKKADEKKDAGKESDEKSGEKGPERAEDPPKPVKVDLDGIGNRIVALGLPASDYVGLATGLKGSVYILERPMSGRFADRGATLSRWTQEDRKTEKPAEGVAAFEISADGKKMLLAIEKKKPGDEAPDGGGPPQWVIVPAEI